MFPCILAIFVNYFLTGNNDVLRDAIVGLERELKARKQDELSKEMEELLELHRKYSRQVSESEARASKTKNRKNCKLRRGRDMELYRLHFQKIRLEKKRDRVEEAIFDVAKRSYPITI